MGCCPRWRVYERSLGGQDTETLRGFSTKQNPYSWPCLLWALLSALLQYPQRPGHLHLLPWHTLPVWGLPAWQLATPDQPPPILLCPAPPTLSWAPHRCAILLATQLCHPTPGLSGISLMSHIRLCCEGPCEPHHEQPRLQTSATGSTMSYTSCLGPCSGCCPNRCFMYRGSQWYSNVWFSFPYCSSTS